MREKVFSWELLRKLGGERNITSESKLKGKAGGGGGEVEEGSKICANNGGVCVLTGSFSASGLLSTGLRKGEAITSAEGATVSFLVSVVAATCVAFDVPEATDAFTSFDSEEIAVS